MKIIIVLEKRLFRASLVLGAKETFPEKTWKRIRGGFNNLFLDLEEKECRKIKCLFL